MTVRGPPVSKQNQVSAQYMVLGGVRAQEVRPFLLLFGVLRVYRHPLFGRPSGGRNLFILRFYRHSLFGRPSGGSIFRCTFFTNLSTKPTTSGGPIFRCTTKDRGERRAKGLQSRPLETGFFIRGFGGETCGLFYVFAVVQLTRFRPVRGVLRTASTDSIVLLHVRRKRWH